MLPRGTERKKQMKINQTRTMLIPEILPLWTNLFVMSSQTVQNRYQECALLPTHFALGAHCYAKVFWDVVTYTKVGGNTRIQVLLLKESDEVMKRLSWLLRIKCGRHSLHFIRKHIDYHKYLISWANPQNQYKFRPKSLVFLFRFLGIRWTTGDMSGTLIKLRSMCTGRERK